MTEINYLITLSYALFTAVTEDIMNLQILAFAIYFALILGIGIFFFFKDKRGGEKEYFLGGRSDGTVGHGNERAGFRICPDGFSWAFREVFSHSEWDRCGSVSVLQSEQLQTG